MKAILASLVFTFSTLHAAPSTLVAWGNLGEMELSDFFGTPLTAGTPANFDGCLLQLGYYSLATESKPFAGTWIPLTGLGSNNSQLLSSIGDEGNRPDGHFKIGSIFDPANPFTGNDLPPSSMPMSIRFYDSVTVGSSSYYNAISSTMGAWDWLAPSDPQAVLVMDVSALNLTWEGGVGSEFRTTLVVPEPGSAALLLACGGLLMGRRARRL